MSVNELPGQPATENSELELRFRAVVETTVDGILTIDERGIIDFVNPAAVRMFGYAPAELLGRNINVLMPAPEASQHDGYLQKYIATGVAKVIGIGREVVGRRADGTLFPLELSVSEFRLGDQRRFTGLVRDISVRKRMEQRAHAAELAAIAANEAKTMFLRSMSHNLRTPLTPIIGYAELLLEDDLTADQREMLTAIVRNGELLLAQISKLIDPIARHEQDALEADLDIPPTSPLWEARTGPQSSSPALRRVLVADDVLENQRLLQIMLTRRGLRVECVGDGDAAVSAVLLAESREEPFDLILMDIQMPGLNGWEATRRLRSIGFDTTIIAITALALPDEILECLDAGCQEVLTKPVKASQLDDVLFRWLTLPTDSDVETHTLLS